MTIWFQRPRIQERKPYEYKDLQYIKQAVRRQILACKIDTHHQSAIRMTPQVFHFRIVSQTVQEDFADAREGSFCCFRQVFN